MSNGIASFIDAFCDDVNASAQASILIKSWTRIIRFHAKDLDSLYEIEANGDVLSHNSGPASAGYDIMICGNSHHLIDALTGKKNPAEQLITGEIDVFATDRDQMRLDAISMALWGW